MGRSGFHSGKGKAKSLLITGGGPKENFVVDLAGSVGVMKADMRLRGTVVVMQGAGAPTDGVTGDNFAGIGSMYIDVTNGNLYLQTGVITSPVWKLVTRAP
jgi:hypothetical protein